MAHYTRTHKSAARLQMHTPGWNQREHTRPCNGFLYTLIPWPRYSLARKSCTSEHENFPPLRIDGNSSLAFNHRSFCASIPRPFRSVMLHPRDGHPHNSLLPSPASFSGQSPTRPTTTTPISTSSCVRSMNRVWGNWWTSGPGRHPRTPTGEKRLDDTRK